MSNLNEIPSGKEQLDDEQNELIQLMKVGFDQLDEGVEIHTPSMEWFEHMVGEQTEVIRKKRIKEVTIFLMIAVIIVSMLLFTLYQLPTIFFAVQGLASIFVVFYSVKDFVKQVNKA